MQLKTIATALVIAGAATALAIGAATPSFAAKKKAKAAAEQPTAFCFQAQAPVCGSRGGQNFTYASACFAMKDGAKIIANHACKPAKKMAMTKTGKKKKM
jgi:hypothetical protein